MSWSNLAVAFLPIALAGLLVAIGLGGGVLKPRLKARVELVFNIFVGVGFVAFIIWSLTQQFWVLALITGASFVQWILTRQRGGSEEPDVSV